jgi:GAF domain-containing protein
LKRLLEDDPGDEALLADQASAGYDEVYRLSIEAMSLKDQQTAALTALETQAAKINSILDDELQPLLDLSDENGLSRQTAIQEMEINLNEALTAIQAYTIQPDPNLRSRLAKALFNYYVSEIFYGRRGLSPQERQFFGQLKDIEFPLFIEQMQSLLSATDRLEQLTGLLFLRTVEQEALIEDGIKAKAIAAVAAIEGGTLADSLNTLRINSILSLLAIGLGVLFTIMLSQYITSGIGKLVQGAAALGRGDLAQRIDIQSQDELGSLAGAFHEMADQLSLQFESLEQRVAERTTDLETARLLSERRAQELQVISEISRLISSEQRLEVLLPLITRLVSEKFVFYHVGIFIIDDTGQYAVFQASNSEGGKRMLARGHRLVVGEGSIVGFVARHGIPRIALDVGQDAVFFNNPDLPETRSEMGLPLISRGVTLGVLDVQSGKPGAFTEDDTKNLAILADQVAIAIENARLYQRTQQALREVETLYQQNIQKGWAEIIEQEGMLGYEHTIRGGRKLTRPVESGDIRKAIEDNKIVVSQPDGSPERHLILPISLRGQSIGALKVQATASTRPWTSEELYLAKIVSERLSLALENARLLQDARKQTIKEQTISEVTAKIGASIDLKQVLQTAVEEVGRALPGSEVILELQRAQEK